MTTKRKAKPTPKRDDSLAASALRALRRAARQARVDARRFGTPVYVSRNGKIVAERP